MKSLYDLKELEFDGQGRPVSIIVPRAGRRARQALELSGLVSALSDLQLAGSRVGEMIDARITGTKAIEEAEGLLRAMEMTKEQAEEVEELLRHSAPTNQAMWEVKAYLRMLKRANKG